MTQPQGPKADSDLQGLIYNIVIPFPATLTVPTHPREYPYKEFLRIRGGWSSLVEERLERLEVP